MVHSHECENYLESKFKLDSLLHLKQVSSGSPVAVVCPVKAIQRLGWLEQMLFFPGGRAGGDNHIS